MSRTPLSGIWWSLTHGRLTGRSLINLGNRVSELTLKLTCFAILLLMFSLAFEVAARYLFNRPTIWAWDLAVQFLALVVLSGVGGTYFLGGHVRVDVFSNSIPVRARAIIQAVLSGLLFLICGVFIVIGAQKAWQATLIREAEESFWAPPLFPLRWVLPIGAFLLLLVAIGKLADYVGVASGHKPEGKIDL